MIRSGKPKDWAEAARLIGITRARMTQIGNLILLAPDIQDAILEPGYSASIMEHQLRESIKTIEWNEQYRA